MFRGGFVYMVTNKHHTVLYVGVTSNLANRTYQHKEHMHPNSFSDRYNAEYLVYYEIIESIDEAIKREKNLKKMTRAKKDALVNAFNPEWKDLCDTVLRTLL